MLEEKELTAAASSVALRDEEGAVRADFVERVQQAITTEDSAALRELLGDLHSFDVAVAHRFTTTAAVMTANSASMIRKGMKGSIIAFRPTSRLDFPRACLVLGSSPALWRGG